MKKTALILFCATILTACGAEEKKDAKKPDLVRPAKIAEAFSLKSLGKKVFPGVTEASNKTELAFRVPGLIVKVPVRAGQQVKKGELIAQLDQAPYKNVLADRKARFRLSELELERQRKLFAKKHVAEARLDVTKSNYEAAKVALKRAQDDLSYTSLKAPYDGIIGKINIDNFRNVAAGTTIAEYQGAKEIDIVFSVPENLFLRLNNNNRGNGKVDVTFDALPDRKFVAGYREHETVPDQQTRSFKVTVSMPRPTDLTVLPGMTVSVHVDLSRIYDSSRLTGVLLPVEAVFEKEGKKWVWLLDKDNAARKTEVATRGIEGKYIRVIKGLKTGDKVIAIGVTFIREGQRVRPITKERGL